MQTRPVVATRPVPYRPAPAATLTATVAALIMLLAGCAGPSAPPGTSGAPERVWRTDGYGWTYVLGDGRLRVYETTRISCLPAETLRQIGGPDPDGVLRFGEDDVAEQTVRPGDDGRATLRLLGTAADIDLLPLPGLPEECTIGVADDPVTTFDVFWTTFAEHYNSFDRKNVDWAAVRDRYRPRVDGETGSAELFGILRAMIEPLGDVHTGVTASRDRDFFGLRPGTRELPERPVIEAVDNHLRELGVTRFRAFAGRKLVYADLPDGRGYLRITAFEGYDPDDDSHLASKPELDRMLDAVFTESRVRALRSLIIDVRLNTGGDDALSLLVAGRLTDRPYVGFTKSARNDPDDPARHARAHPASVTPADGPQFTGPVHLLTSDMTVSAGETFIQTMMGRTPAPARIGTTTQGVFADSMTRRLPNGWSFSLGNEDYVGPDGRNWEGAGIPPTVTTPVFPDDELERAADSALDAAN